MYKINYNEDVNVLYNIIASKIAMEINLKDNLKVHIDRSKKPSIIPNFDKMFIHNLAIKNDSCKVSINHNLSHNYKGLQVVDCIAWSFFQEFENNNKEFTNLLKFRYKVIKVK